MIHHPKFRDHILATSGEVAGMYERTFFALSNFSSFAVTWPIAGSEYADQWPVMDGQTSEHLYHAAPYAQERPEIAEQVLLARSAHVARQIGLQNRAHGRPDWDKIKAGVMLSICHAKLLQHEYVQQSLDRTGNTHIVEDSPTDPFWGWGPADEQGNHHGMNKLGQIWMKLRQELRDGTIYPQ